MEVQCVRGRSTASGEDNLELVQEDIGFLLPVTHISEMFFFSGTTLMLSCFLLSI